MNNIKPIMISGPYCCGKGALISLLDSKKVLTLPQWHDMLIDTFYHFCNWFRNNNIYNWRGKDERIIKLRKMLSGQDYPMLEQYALQKKIVFPISSNKYESFDFDYDYYNQTKEFFEKVYKLEPEEINPRDLFNLFIDTFINNFKNLQNKNYEYFVSASEPGFTYFEDLIVKMPDIKIIYILKEDWVVSYTKRLLNEGYDPKASIFNDRRLNGIIKAEKECFMLQNKFSDNFKIVNFEELIMNHSKTVKEIIDFIGLEDDPIYYIPTFLDKKINSQEIVGKIIDKEDGTNVYSAEINSIQREYYKSKGKFDTSPSFENREKYKFQESTEKILPKDISVVIQGNVTDKKLLRKNIKNIRKLLPKSEIILSTWKNCNIENIDYDVLVLNADPGSYDMYPVTYKTNNVNRQIISCYNGIKKSTRKYILKLRTDCCLKNANFLKYANDNNIKNLKRIERFTVFKERVIVDSYFTRNSEFNSVNQLGLCFHPSDIWMFGLKEDLESFFNIPLQEKYIVNINGNNYQYRVPEQYLWTKYLEKNNWSIFMDSCLYNTPYISDLSIKSILNNFFVLNHNKSGIILPKKFKKQHPKFTFKYVLTSKRFFELYKEHNEENYKIPNEFKYTELSQVFGVSKYIAELKNLLKPIESIIKIPIGVIKLLFKIIYKIIFNSYKLIWWLK